MGHLQESPETTYLQAFRCSIRINSPVLLIIALGETIISGLNKAWTALEMTTQAGTSNVKGVMRLASCSELYVRLIFNKRLTSTKGLPPQWTLYWCRDRDSPLSRGQYFSAMGLMRKWHFFFDFVDCMVHQNGDEKIKRTVYLSWKCQCMSWIDLGTFSKSIGPQRAVSRFLTEFLEKSKGQKSLTGSMAAGSGWWQRVLLGWLGRRNEICIIELVKAHGM